MSAGGYLRNADLEWKNSSDQSLAKIAATANTLTLSSVGGSGVTVSGVAAPSASSDCATKGYVDGLLNGLSWKAPARCAATSNFAASNNGSGTLTATSNGSLSLGGVSSFDVNDRVLLTAQTTAADNGVYTVSNAGGASAQAVLVRAQDADSSAELQSLAIFVGEGTSAQKAYVQSTDGTISVNTTALAFVAFSSTTLATGSVTADAIAANAVGASELADNSVDSSAIVDANVTTAKLADSNVTTAKLADSNVTTAKLADSNVTTGKIADDAVTSAKIAAGAVDSTALAADAVSASALADDCVVSAAIASGAVTSAALDTNIAISGTCQAVSFQATSDMRKKENIQPISSAECLEKCLRFNAVRYNFINTDRGRRRVGLIAQECEHICSEAVQDDKDGYKSISYMDLVPLLCGAVQALQESIRALKEEVAATKS
jgi:hypothetical protein